MKSYVAVCTICLVVFMLGSPLRAQIQEVSADQPPKTGLRKVGLTFGFGVADMNLSQMNNRLQELEIGKLEEVLTNFEFGLYSEIYGGIGASFNISIGKALESIAYSQNAMIGLSTLAVGANFHISLLHTNRFRLQVLGGPRFNDMRFEYNMDTNTAPDLDDLLINPSGNSHAIVLESVSANESAVVGARFQYRVGKKERLKQHEVSLGIDSGYNFSIGEVRWRDPYSKVPVQNMPSIRPDHFYLNFTISANLLR